MTRARKVNAVWIVWIAISILVCPAFVKGETLVWQASSGVVEGYRVYWSTSRGDLTNSHDVGNNTRYDLNRLPLTEGLTYYLCVSAYNAAGESPPCAPVVFTPGDNTPPAPPTGLSAE